MKSSPVSAPARSAPLSVVAVVGSTHRPSKTAVRGGLSLVLGAQTEKGRPDHEPATTGSTVTGRP